MVVDVFPLFLPSSPMRIVSLMTVVLCAVTTTIILANTVIIVVLVPTTGVVGVDGFVPPSTTVTTTNTVTEKGRTLTKVVDDRQCQTCQHQSHCHCRYRYRSGLLTLTSSLSSKSSKSSSEEYEILRSSKLWNAGSRTTTSPISSNSNNNNNNKYTLVVLLPQLGEFDSSEFCEQLVAVFSPNSSKSKSKSKEGNDGDKEEEGTSNNNNKDNDVELVVIGIAGSDTDIDATAKAAERFCNFTGLDPDCLFIDPDATIHRQLKLYSGPSLHVPQFVSYNVIRFVLDTLPGGAPPPQEASQSSSSFSDSSSDGDSCYNDDDKKLLRQVADGWLNYLAMCAGIGAPGTLQEIIRGYVGDTSAPERFREDDVVKVVFDGILGTPDGIEIEIGPGVGPVRLGTIIKYNQWFADERGYQRPVELATVRLKNMVEVLQNWDVYVSDPSLVSQRGATFLFDNNNNGNDDGDDNNGTKLLYEYRHRGVLTYSETMSRPLTFLAPYIGNDKALNPLGLPDNNNINNIPSGSKNAAPRGILKPVGKAMNFFSPIFNFETNLQARLVGVTQSDILNATDEINIKVQSCPVVVFTYGLSPFSSQAIQLLQGVCNDVTANADRSNENDDGNTDLERTLVVDELGLEWFLLTDVESCAKRLALLEMTGQSSLPHIFIGGKHVGGLFTSPDGVSGGIAGLQETQKLKSMIKEAVMSTTSTSLAKT